MVPNEHAPEPIDIYGDETSDEGEINAGKNLTLSKQQFLAVNGEKRSKKK